MLLQVNKRSLAKNLILANLPLSDLAMIGEFLEPILLRERAILHEPREQVEHVYFPETGVVSLRTIAAGSVFESAIVGYRGVVGAPCLFGECNSTYQSIVLFPGRALRIRVEDMRRLMNERAAIRENLLQYVQALNCHCAQMGLCGVRHNLGQRLACWLCLACDAIGSDVIPVTHEYLSLFLGLRRTGVTETLIRFEDLRLIRKRRGVLQIDDRKRLEQEACCCYAIIAREYGSREATNSDVKRAADSTSSA